jgi:hypothetical protein
MVALPALTAAPRETPPIVTGPLVSKGHDCYTAPSGNSDHCVYLFMLDPASTSEPRRAWRAYWVTDRSGVPTLPGYCTTEVVDALTWGTAGRPGPPPARTYPTVGSRSVTPGALARLVVDAGGHATKPSSLEQRSRWTPGIVMATVRRGQFVVLWEGRTTRFVPFTLAAEVGDPGREFALVGATNFQLSAPCAHVPPPGPGFLAQIKPGSVKSGQTAWLQVRIPGIRPRLILRSSSFTWPVGKATVTISKAGVAVFGPQRLNTVGGRYVLPLTYPAGSYLAAVTLQGPTGTRQYRLPFEVG